MLIARGSRGFTMIEALVALSMMLAGLAGGSLVLLQSVRYERESSNRRAAIRLAASLAEELRALKRGDGVALPADDPVIAEWVSAAEAALPDGSTASVAITGSAANTYEISIEWPVSGAGPQRLVLPVTP